MSTRPSLPRLATALALLTLPACTGPTAPAAAPTAPIAVEGQPAAVATPAPVAATALVGRVETWGHAPVASAAVKAYVLGSSQVIAAGGGNPQGGFSLELPEGVRPGTLLKVTAVAADGASFATLIQAPAARQVADAEDEVVLSVSTTLAYLMVGPRFEAAGQASRTGSDAVLSALQAVTRDVFRSLSQEAQKALAAAPSEALRDAITHSLADDGHATIGTAATNQLASAFAGLSTAFIVGVRDLQAGIRQAIANGGSQPDTALLQNFSFGGSTATYYSNGGSAGPSLTTEDVTVQVNDGEIVPPAGDPVIVTKPKK